MEKLDRKDICNNKIINDRKYRVTIENDSSYISMNFLG